MRPPIYFNRRGGFLTFRTPGHPTAGRA